MKTRSKQQAPVSRDRFRSPLEMNSTSFDFPNVLPRMRSSGSSFGGFNSSMDTNPFEPSISPYPSSSFLSKQPSFGSIGYMPNSFSYPIDPTPSYGYNYTYPVMKTEDDQFNKFTPSSSFDYNPNFPLEENTRGYPPQPAYETPASSYGYKKEVELPQASSKSKRKLDNSFYQSYRKPKRPSYTESMVSLGNDSVDTNASTTTSHSRKGSRQKWTKGEDEKLRNAVAKCDGRNWKQVSEEVATGKTHIQCLQRWKQVLQPGLVKGAWATEEDDRLMQLMKAFGGLPKQNGKRAKFGQWKKIEQYMNGRTAKQCRERWLLNLDPSINKSEWKPEEDKRLLELQASLGNSWSKMKDILNTNRTENAVKLRFNFLKKLRLKHGEENFLKHVEYKADDRSKKNNADSKQENATTIAVQPVFWSKEDDEMLILARKYYRLRYDQMMSKIPTFLQTKSKSEVEKRWKYLCMLDQDLNRRVSIAFTDLDKARLLASTEAARVAQSSARYTPENLATIKNPMEYLDSLPSVKETANVVPYDHFDPNRVYQKESLKENEFDEVLAILSDEK